MRMRCIRLLLVLTLSAATLAQAGTPTDIAISQAQAEGTAVTAYVTVRDETGDPVTGIKAGQFQATLGAQVAEVSSVTPFAETGEGVLSVLLVDVSRSIDAARFERIRQALRDWVAALGERDQAALLTFGATVRTLVAPTADRAALNAAIDTLAPTDAQTALHQALAQGLALGRQRGADLPPRRALVMLSDGIDDAPGGMTAEEVEAQLTEGTMPIYAIGVSRVRDRAAREAGLAALGRLARRSGGLFSDAGTAEPTAAYAAMRARIRAVERIQVSCPGCVADGNRYRLLISLTHAGLALSDGVDVRLYPPVAAPVPDEPASPVQPVSETLDETPPAPAVLSPDSLPSWWPYLLTVPLAALLGVWLFMRRRRLTHAGVDEALSLDVSDPPLPQPARPPLTTVFSTRTPRIAPTGPALMLTLMNGKRRGETVRLVLAPEALIGRAAGCALTLAEDDEVSAGHARLSRQGQRILLEDLGSTNGTWLNGVPLSAPHPVRDGDVLRLGQTELRLGGIDQTMVGA